MTRATEVRDVLAEILPRLSNEFGDVDHWEWGALVEFQRELAKAGWGAPAWPVEHGGLALDVADQVAAIPESSSGLATGRSPKPAATVWVLPVPSSRS